MLLLKSQGLEEQIVNPMLLRLHHIASNMATLPVINVLAKKSVRAMHMLAQACGGSSAAIYTRQQATERGK